MTPTETANLLTLIKRYDNRKFDDATVIAWHHLLADLTYDHCVNAVTDHFRESTTYLLPAHIRHGAQAHAQRIAGQQQAALTAQRVAIDCAPVGTRGPATNRSPEVNRLVAELAVKLGPGRPDQLRYKDPELHRRHPKATDGPNPRFRGWINALRGQHP